MSSLRTQQHLTIFLFITDYGKSTILSLCTMDHNKINYDLVVAVLEWIVEEEHEVTLCVCL